jgi:hypothetical protein
MTSRDWCASIDAYCERTDAAFWSEPVNAVSNAAFLAAAWLAYRLWRRSGRGDRSALALIALTAVVGVGSFLFHTFANRWSLLADVLPITVFIYSYFALAMTRYFGRGFFAAVALALGFAVFNAAFLRGWSLVFGASGVDWTNGSVGYFPAAFAMLGVGALLLWQAWRRSGDEAVRMERAGHALMLASAIFSVSLVFRSIDLAVCSWLATGTHFLWHLLNAAVLFILVKAALNFRPRSNRA